MNKEEFKNTIKETSAVSKTGNLTINVVNIQKFSEDSSVKEADYNVDVQRIYFLDERGNLGYRVQISIYNTITKELCEEINSSIKELIC